MSSLDWHHGIAIFARAFGCGLFVWIVLRAVADAPPAWAAVIISQPLAIATSFFAIAAAESDAFVREAALRGAQTIPALLIFLTLVAANFARLTKGSLLALGLAGWLVAALILTGSLWPFWATFGATVIMIAASHRVFPINARLILRISSGKRSVLWPAALQGGAIVVILSLFSSYLGPRFSAILSAVPVAMIFVTISMKASATPKWAETYQSARLGLPSLSIYLGAIWALIPFTGAVAACFAALLPSFALSLVTVRLRAQFSARMAQ
ncbi:hypothetical protein P775_21190 [Puniceibacterium antarcticum]|uniref:Uncharacterized protein n=1 Tax=Puniceibacterium antarcticum TaxID=1206336 RepID=A0A2G8R9J3_9RHOB|nr:hypothetical protein [Puniceibacterium antarcticum]PIL18163.1 hypothetical protein P775_21190 [Puniceibacterium antarcticum]